MECQLPQAEYGVHLDISLIACAAGSSADWVAQADLPPPRTTLVLRTTRFGSSGGRYL
jgi:hypothetical protein